MRFAYLLLGLTATAVADVRLQIQAPAGYENVVSRIRNIPPARLERLEQILGTRPNVDIPVQVISEVEADEHGIPEWVAGYEMAGRIVIIPSRAVTYPNDGLEDLVLHEIAHVLMDGLELPTWFHEGVAMFSARGWTLEDRTRLAITLMSSGGTPLRQLSFSSDTSHAYSLAGAFTQYLVAKHGAGVIASILGQVAQGRSFEAAFRGATGMSLLAAEDEFWKTNSIWNRWIPLVTSSLVLWIIVSLFAIGAISVKRRRDAERLRQWAEQEKLETKN